VISELESERLKAGFEKFKDLVRRARESVAKERDRVLSCTSMTIAGRVGRVLSLTEILEGVEIFGEVL